MVYDKNFDYCYETCQELNATVPNYDEFYRLNHTRIYEEALVSFYSTVWDTLTWDQEFDPEIQKYINTKNVDEDKHPFDKLEFDVNIYYNFHTKNWQTEQEKC